MESAIECINVNGEFSRHITILFRIPPISYMQCALGFKQCLFEQFDNLGELIWMLGKLNQKLNTLICKSYIDKYLVSKYDYPSKVFAQNQYFGARYCFIDFDSRFIPFSFK